MEDSNLTNGYHNPDHDEKQFLNTNGLNHDDSNGWHNGSGKNIFLYKLDIFEIGKNNFVQSYFLKYYWGYFSPVIEKKHYLFKIKY